MGATTIPLSMDDQHYSQHGVDMACMATPWLASMGFVIAFSGESSLRNFKRTKYYPCILTISFPMMQLWQAKFGEFLV